MAAFDNAQVADAYSQLTAVIAGFSFSCLVGLLAYRFGASSKGALLDRRMQSALLLFFSCFIGMTTSSLAYSVLSGMKDFALALNVGHVVAGTGFGVAGLMGLLGIHQLVLCSGLRIEREIGIVAGSLVPVLITGYQVLGLYLVDGYGAAVFGLCVVLVTLAVASIAPHLKASGDSLKSSSIWSHSTLSLVGLAFSSAPSLAVCILAALAQNATVPIWPAYVAIVPTFIMSSWVMLTFQRVVENPPEAVIEPAVELAEKISLEGPRVNSAETGK